MLFYLPFDADADRLAQLGVGGGIVVVVLGMVFAFILKWRAVRVEPEPVKIAASNGKAGEVAVSFWENKNREIFQSITDGQLKPLLQEIRQERIRENAEILECLRRLEIDVRTLLERRTRAR